METRVVSVLEGYFWDTFVVVDGSVANELDLGDPWDGVDVCTYDPSF